MTEEDLFKVYIKRELCVHCRFPQFCKSEDKCSNIATAKRHYLAGLEADNSADYEYRKVEKWYVYLEPDGSYILSKKTQNDGNFITILAECGKMNT